MERRIDAASASHTARLLAIYSLLTALRYPWLMFHGRVWAEEGTLYLSSAWSSAAIASFLAPHLGYYALWPNLIALLAARVFALQSAALVFVWCAFLVQVLAGYLVVRCEAFSTSTMKTFALLVLLITAPSRQVWLNTINSQFYFAICAAIIYLSRSDRLKIQRTFVLAVAGFTGPVTTFLTPFFLLRAFRERTRGAYVQAGVLTICALTQIALVIKFLHAGARRISFQPSGIAPTFLSEYVTLPFFSRIAERYVAPAILHRPPAYLVTGHTAAAHLKAAMMAYRLPFTWPYLLMLGMVDVAFIILLMWITFDRSDRSSWWLLAMSLWLAIFSIYGAVGGTYAVAERYVFPSAVLMGLALLPPSIRPTTHRARKIAARFLLAIFLLSGIQDYFSYATWMGYEKPAGPGWHTQVMNWKKHPGQRLTVWPKGFGSFTLSPDHRQDDHADEIRTSTG